MRIDARGMHFSALNEKVRSCAESEIEIDNCIGQRYIACGLSGKKITVNGTPGNALGAYLDGCDVTVRGDVQEATGDTMNGGSICVFGSAGDATGYAMRGGRIFVEGNVGYRCGIHMKAYKENKPAIVIGGKAGSFLGEYQAGGIIVVLGDGAEGSPVGNFCGTGMHGGEMYIRGDALPKTLPPQVKAERLERFPEGEAAQLVRQWCDAFGKESERYLSSPCFRLTPDSANPYKQMYTPN